MFVNAAGLSVHVCLVVIAIQHLDFIHVLQEDAAVAASLACTGDVFRYAPFDMQLEVLEFLFCQDVAFLLVYSENAVFYDPFGGAALSVLPSGKVFSVNRTMASEGALFVLMSPGVTTFGCGVQYSDIPGFIFSCSGYCFCALALTQAVQANAAKAVFIVMLLFMV